MKSRAVMPSKRMKAAFTSERVEIFRHPQARFGVGHRPLPRGQVVAHVVWPAGAGDGAGHRGMADDPFQEVLRPALDTQLAGPGRQDRKSTRLNSSHLV